VIVADTNLLAYLLLGGSGTDLARRVFLRDPEWSAPYLWRSEFRSVLAQYLRNREIDLPDALVAQRRAEALLSGREYLVESQQVLRLISDSRCSAHDCEFVALAKQLRVPLVTSDRQILTAFPQIAFDPTSYVRSAP
jgi:predicted nucleic acid-binding protein